MEKTYLFILILLSAALVMVLALWWIRERRRGRQIQELIDYITRIQDYSTLPEMQKIGEGNLGILQSEIYKVVTILRGEYSEEHRQKKYISDMLSDISHQFKTPLTAISLMTELLMGPDVSEESRLDYAHRIDQETSRIIWLIKNLLTLSQLEAGVLEMKKEAIDLRFLIQQIQKTLEIQAEVAEVDILADIPSGLMIQGDPGWLQEAFSNIVKNAVEHTPPQGKVQIQATQNNLSTSITIEDNGQGIDSKDLGHIFERFYRAGNASKDSVGIGLAVSKQIIQNHGGSITVRSEKGTGTCFTVKLMRD